MVSATLLWSKCMFLTYCFPKEDKDFCRICHQRFTLKNAKGHATVYLECLRHGNPANRTVAYRKQNTVSMGGFIKVILHRKNPVFLFFVWPSTDKGGQRNDSIQISLCSTHAHILTSLMCSLCVGRCWNFPPPWWFPQWLFNVVELL